MATTTQTLTSRAAEAHKPFSLRLYLMIVFGLSWPFQIAFAVWGNTPPRGYLLSSLSMVMVTVGTYIAGR